MRTRDRLTGQSALQAYQSDIPLGGMEPTPEDHAAVLVATLLRQSLMTDNDEASGRIVAEAEAIARRSLGAHALELGCIFDDRPATSRTDVMRVLVQRTDQGGRLNLAQHLLESLAEIVTEPIDAGQVLADRSRTSRKLGYLDLSYEQAQEVLRVGRKLRSAALMSRGYSLLSAIGETRGNRVASREAAVRSLRFARAAGLRTAQATNYVAIATSDAMAGRYGDAVKNFWRAYGLSGGTGVIGRSVLGNLAQTLLVSGRPAEARKVATILLQQSPPALIALPAIGCYALASASQGDVEAVTWACDRVRQLAKSRHEARESAEALIECAAALEAIGQDAKAGVMRRRGEGIANRHGFHDLTFKEAVLSARRGGRPEVHFHAAAAGATAEIVEMDVPRIPQELEAQLK